MVFCAKLAVRRVTPMTDEDPAKGWDLFKWKRLAEPPEWFAIAVYGLLFVVFFLIAASGMIALFQLLVGAYLGGAPPVQTAPGTDPGADLRGRLLVIGALLTTPFLIWRLIVGHWAARAAQEQAQIAQETARNTLFAKAIEQLGATREEKKTTYTQTGSHDELKTAPNTEVRLGAIYALEKLARDDLTMHWPIMETLWAYVRENAGKPRPLHPDVRTTLARRISERTAEGKSKLSTDRNLTSPPSVDVQAAISVIGRRTARQREYERAQRQNRANGSGDAWRLDLSNCHLARANFAGLDFSAARFEGSTLHWSNSSLASLEDARLREAHLEAANLSEAKLTGASFVQATLTRASLGGARAEGASFNGAHLEGVSLSGAHLEGADFFGAHFGDAWLGNAVLVDARLDESDLADARGVSQSQVDAAWGDQNTALPPDCGRPANDRWRVGVDLEKQLAASSDYQERRKFWLSEARRRPEPKAND